MRKSENEDQRENEVNAIIKSVLKELKEYMHREFPKHEVALENEEERHEVCDPMYEDYEEDDYWRLAQIRRAIFLYKRFGEIACRKRGRNKRSWEMAMLELEMHFAVQMEKVYETLMDDDELRRRHPSACKKLLDDLSNHGFTMLPIGF